MYIACWLGCTMCKRFIFAIIVLLFFGQTSVAQNADDYLDRLERAESALKADFLVMQIWDAWLLKEVFPSTEPPQVQLLNYE